jgi:hypothetical protein
MRKRRTLSDLYRFPGCKPKKIIHGIFGDPHARVIKLVRRGKKLLVGYAAPFIGLSVPARYDGFVISPAGEPGFISIWKFGVSCVEGAAQ